MTSANTKHESLTRFAWISVAAAVATIILKSVAYLLTDSVGLLSDALESLVNLVGALMALAMLTIAARPADEEHAFGHNKAEYFSSGVEGMLILIAALGIIVAAIPRLISPKPLEQVGLGLAVSFVASVINLFVARSLMKAGKRFNSITLEADSQHLMTDVWTSAGVLAGIGAVVFTGWQVLDPVIAILVAGNIVWSGIKIVRRSISGLMDSSLSVEELNSLRNILEKYSSDGIQYHALRTRRSGSRHFISFHVLVPGKWTVECGHKLLENIEADIRKTFPKVTIFSHLESLEDPTSWEDINLDRE